MPIMPQSPTAYLDKAGRPRLRESIVAFIDILGFSQSSISCTSIEDAQHLLDKIAAAIDDSRSFVRESIADGESAVGSRWATKFFSDNLAFGYPFDEEADSHASSALFIIRSAQRYQLKMTMNGFFVRGALTQGPICLTDEIIFGSALIECYQLESKASIVPRIVLAEPLQQLVIKSFRESGGQIETGIEQAICRDVDGWWFVNYLAAAQDSRGVQWDLIEQHKTSILESLSHTTRHDVLPKYGWACRYHNVFCHWHRDDPGYSDRYRISRVDEHSTIYRLSDTTEDSPQRRES
jgi:hypothetical protein